MNFLNETKPKSLGSLQFDCAVCSKFYPHYTEAGSEGHRTHIVGIGEMILFQAFLKWIGSGKQRWSGRVVTSSQFSKSS